MDLIGLNTLTYKVHEYNLEKAWIGFENTGFKPILIKGWYIAQFYNEPFSRRYSDIDLIINPKDYSEAIKFLQSFKENIAIDLHNGARHLDSVSYENLYENSRLVKCGETEVRVLRPEDHLRVLCVHWLTDGGENKERLWDIYYAVANRSKDFDWDRCLNVVSEKRRKWIVYTIGLAHKYLGLDVSDTPIAHEVGNFPKWLIETLEKEWKSDERLIPLHQCLHDKKRLFKQIKKRIPPNPIQATIDMEGDFDNKPRIFYQIGDIFFRLKPSITRLIKTLRFSHTVKEKQLTKNEK
jgi:hypothetical protein